MRSMKPDKDIAVSTIRIPTAGGSIPALVGFLQKEARKTPLGFCGSTAAGILPV